MGDKKVIGTGPARLSIRIVDVSWAGEQIGSGTIDENGKFDISVDPPIESNHTIGIMLGSLDGTKYKAEDFSFGEGYKDYPMIGLVVTSTHALGK